jgi:Tfp pilus assembly protein FimV
VPAPPTGTLVAPDDRGATAEGPPPAMPDSANQARWRATDKQPRMPRERLLAKPRSPAEAPGTASEPVVTQTPAVASEPVAAAASVAAPLGPGRFHVVRPGESLWSIASRVLRPGASDRAVALEVRRLWRLNSERIGTSDPNLLRIGVRLRLR